MLNTILTNSLFSPHDPLMLFYIGCTEGLMVVWSFNKLLSRNSRSWRPYFCYMLVYISATIFDAYNNFKVYFVMIICYLLIMGIAFIFYDDPEEIRLLIPFVFIAINYASTIVATIIVWAAASWAIPDFPPNLRMGYASQTLLCILFFLSVNGISLLKRTGRDKSPIQKLLLFVLCPLVLLVLVLSVYYTPDYPLTLQNYTAHKLMIAASLYLIAIILFTTSNRAAKMHEAILHSASLEQLIAVQQTYYLSLQEHQQKLRHLSHDIKNHNRAIHGLISLGKYDEALAYSESLVQNAETLTPVTECRNVLIGAMLNDRLGAIKNEGVRISLCIMVPEQLNIKDPDMCILLGNLFDNSVEACRADKLNSNRFIDIDIRLKGPMLYIKVKNSFSGNINFSNNTYITTKPDAIFHGIGLHNVKQVVAKYSGRTIIEHKDNVFSVTVILFHPTEPE